MSEPRIVVSLDVAENELEAIVEKTAAHEAVTGYKLGFMLGLEISLKEAVKRVREFTDKPLMYDHQKAATDIPATASGFSRVCKEAGIDQVILFPFTGKEVLQAWVNACKDIGLEVLVGGIMTHPGFFYSEGGFLQDDRLLEIYADAADLGVKSFVTPGTRLDTSEQILNLLRNRNIEPVFYSPGIGTQGGKVTDLLKNGYPVWHAIVGRSITQANDPFAAISSLIQASPNKS